MENLRIINVTLVNSSSILVRFTHPLTTSLSVSNIQIKSEVLNVPDSKVTSIIINGKDLNIFCLPLTSLSNYTLQFNSTDKVPFVSENNNAKLLEDGVANKYGFLGPSDPENPVKTYFTTYFRDNLYNIDNENTVVGNYIRSLTDNLSKALYNIRQVKNENYLSLTINDERKVRGEGPFDRLSEESAYEIIRVGRTETGMNVSKALTFSEFPFYPITLQQENVTETLKISSSDEVGKFNINNLILNVLNSNVTKVKSIIFTINSTNPIYKYNIEKLGYQILDSRYDQDYAFTYPLLKNNQIKLNDQILQDPLFDINNIFSIEVQYQYKSLNTIIESGSVVVTSIYNQIREVLPPIINIFNLKHAPIVDSDGNIATNKGVTFLDPNAAPGAVHPAFKNEIPFRLEGLPSIPGQYSIDYATGTVYVYGESLTNDGTGPYPPLATYKYRVTFKEEQDYTYDYTTYDLVALPLGNLVNNTGKITFNYEQVLIPGVDYVANVHKEILNERIENRLLALNTIKLKNSPATNVFKVYNETSGEVYNVERWNNDKAYISYSIPPNISPIIREKIKFNTISNELLYVDTVLSNNSLKIFKIILKNNNIVSLNEDSFASSISTSLVFSKSNIFINEKWFDRGVTLSLNLNRLTTVGEYCVDYKSGIVYCAVSNTQDNNIGTATYKNKEIVLENPHIMYVNDIYYQIDINGIKNKKISFLSFKDGFVIPQDLDYSDEYSLNNSDSLYQVVNNEIGSFVDANFISGVSNQVQSVRGVFEFDDLNNSTNPINFAKFATYNNYNINVYAVTNSVYKNINFDGTNYYIILDESIPYLSPNIDFTFSVVRISDSAELWDNAGIIITGDPLKLILSGANNPAVGEFVNVNYSFEIKDASRVVVDYGRGDFCIDYSSLVDEILVSYEYGENVLDFRASTSVPANTGYYVSYRVGALRDALLSNFGKLINIPELSDIDLNFDRERYRDALIATMSSFIQGPTIGAIKNIGKQISHIEPEIIESSLLNWSLGSSLLSPQNIKTTGEFTLLPAKFNNGVLINSLDQTITFPASSNIRLEEGTFETWILPQWNGIDNDAELIFTILQNNLPLPSNKIFVGKAELHPDLIKGKLTIKKSDLLLGTPNFNKDGVFIYYDKDMSGSFNRWYVKVVDGYVDGYASNYKFNIASNGSFYDTKSINTFKPSELTVFSGINNINFTLNVSSPLEEGITFVSDVDHYILDFGQDKNVGRFSLYKDASGYLNFKVHDIQKNVYSVSADVSSWKINEAHHIAISWKLNNRDSRDEMHLFIDGAEVPNIIKYNQKLQPYLHEKFRSISLEEILGASDKDIIYSTDLVVTKDSNVVSSKINFSSYNISVGDIIYIDEQGFNTSGYGILNINGQTLVLDDVMPVTLSNARFSVNRTSFIVQSDINISPNIAVSTLSAFVVGSDIVGSINSNVLTSASNNFSNLGVKPGDLLRINNPLFNKTYTIVSVSANSIIVEDYLPTTLTGDIFQIYNNQEKELPGVRALSPYYSVSKDANFNDILTISNGVFANDLILIRTLGLNHRLVRHKHYVWQSNVESIITTKLPPPISLDEVKVTKVLLPATIINNSNASLIGGIYYSDNISVTPVSNTDVGRTLSFTISGNNVDFSTPVVVTINGLSGINTITETITFTDYGTLDSVNAYHYVNYVKINVKPINLNKNAVVIECKEKYSITNTELGVLQPVIKFSYPINSGNTLYSTDGYVVRDDNNLFNGSEIGNYLIISSPYLVAGFYKITGISEDRKSLYINSTVAAFTLPLINFINGEYQIVNTTEFRSGLQNGFFTFEVSYLPSQGYLLSKGFYELEYNSYVKIPMSSESLTAFIGSDFNKSNHANAIIDQVKIYSVMLTDTRVGESIPSNQRSITKDYNSLKPLKKDANTLMLLDFNFYPFTNDSYFYTNISNVEKTPKYFQSSIVVNENFNNSLVLLDKPIVLSNDGILNPKKQGTVEFWISPIFDAANDPQERYYFDAFGAIVENVTSADNTSVKVSSSIGEVLSVRLTYGDPKIDYFAGGSIDVDTQNATQEQTISTSNNVVVLSNLATQIIKVEVVGDLTKSDYFADGKIGSNSKTIYLGKPLPSSNTSVIVTYKSISNKNTPYNTQIIRLNKKLPYQNSQVTVTYLPKGIQGDRISLFKDKLGYINFQILAAGNKYLVQAPVRWAKNTWHRLKASYKVNGGIGNDEMRLFIDGYEYSNIILETNSTASVPSIINTYTGNYGIKPNIKFKDSINTLYLGSQFNEKNPAFCLIDNLRISDISRPIYAPYGYPIDINYNSNINVVFPVTLDLYTTYLLNFDKLIGINDDFAVIKNRNTGSFNFSVNVLDSFGIVNSSIQVQQALEKLIKVLKPANSKVFIKYIR